MDVSGDQPARTAGPGVQLGPAGIGRSLWRRRPSGQPPPLPHQLQTTGVGWLIAAVVSVVLSLLVFAGGLQGLAVDVTVIDAGVVGWVAGLQAPGLLAPQAAEPAAALHQALGSIGSVTRFLFHGVAVLLFAFHWTLDGNRAIRAVASPLN